MTKTDTQQGGRPLPQITAAMAVSEEPVERGQKAQEEHLTSRDTVSDNLSCPSMSLFVQVRPRVST